MKIFPTYLSQCDHSLFNIFKSEATVYFHWPFCKNICTFCNFNKYKRSENKLGQHFENKMENSLLRETQTIFGLTGVNKIKSIYFGGGTPSLAPPTTISRLIQCVKQLANTDEKIEITIECNPSSLNMTQKLEEYFKFGVNRVSVGLQSLDDKKLKILGRDHSANDGLMLLKQATEIFGSDSVSVDLLFRKPGDTIKSWENELIQMLEHKPHHVSLYELTPEKGTRLFRELKSGELTIPNENDTASMYLLAVKLLKESSLERYEISNFAKAGSRAQSLHNMSYWHGTQYLGIGPGAHSRIFPLDADLRESRIQTLDPQSWQDLVERDGHATRLCKQQNRLEVLSELLVTSLRTTKGTQPNRWNLFQPQYSMKDVFGAAEPLKFFYLNGYLRWGMNGSFQATDRGLNVVDAILPTVLNVLGEYHTRNKFSP
ncbi:radical S-adenosyl methionine domain-containing protein 1, mitochondrial-like [Daphnia carinata]|uniref:radical S-adenosyl methionine domain-containing protein 1, mitochondrial-like n=1 Tax=Daphnia carinata TaxID=120202 RepID=UPI00257B0874|nr:radical S-adenosyl methionine domain-containing protein 1, mitochondrial-like [Daphnia carinata]